MPQNDTAYVVIMPLCITIAPKLPAQRGSSWCGPLPPKADSFTHDMREASLHCCEIPKCLSRKAARTARHAKQNTRPKWTHVTSTSLYSGQSHRLTKHLTLIDAFDFFHFYSPALLFHSFLTYLLFAVLILKYSFFDRAYRKRTKSELKGEACPCTPLAWLVIYRTHAGPP